MVQLLILVMGIALASYVVMAGISYFNVDGIKAKEREAQWSTLNLSLAQGWVDFQRLYRRAPVSVEELLSQAVIHVNTPDGMTLTEVGQNYSGWCFSGQANKDDVEALVNLATRYPVTYALDDSCGASNGLSSGWSPTESPNQPVSITYRLNPL